MQVKLLRVLQERTVRPLGGAMDVSVDVRLIASTNRDLKKMVASGQFREDFYYRVSVIPIHVPPLRERPSDIEPLARHFLRKFALQMGKPLSDFDPEALAALRRWSWPGNVRELENAVEHAVAVSDGRDGVVKLANFPGSVTGTCRQQPGRGSDSPRWHRLRKPCFTDGKRVPASRVARRRGSAPPRGRPPENVLPIIPPLREEIWDLMGSSARTPAVAPFAIAGGSGCRL